MKYIIEMTKGNGKSAYVLTESDYNLGGFIDINVDDFSIDSIEEAKAIKVKLDTYAKSKGDNFTEFFIETLLVTKTDGRKNNGGKRAGAGHPFNATTKPMSFRVDMDLLDNFPGGTNRNGYINNAIREKMIREGIGISKTRPCDLISKKQR